MYDTIDALKAERARLRGEHERRRLAFSDPTLRDTIARMETRKRARIELEDGEREVVLPDEDEESCSSDEDDADYDVLEDLQEQVI